MRSENLERLLERTDDRDPAEVEVAWAAEIERRVEEIRSGRAELVSSEQLFQELDAIVEGGDEGRDEGAQEA